MKEINTEIEINASAEKVWQLLTDFAAYPQWNPFIRSVNGKPEEGDKVKSEFRAVDGTKMEVSAFSDFDIVGLATTTGAPNVQFNLSTGVSSTRRRREPMSTEIFIELARENRAGRPLRARHAVVHPEGQIPMTGLRVAMILERLLGLDGKPATPPGLYFPYKLLGLTAYLDRLKQIGGMVLTMEVL
jgi:hypothetical protein